MSAHTDCVYLREINRGEREAMGEQRASTMNLVLRGLNFRQLTSAVTAGDDDLARAVAQDAIRDVQRAAIDFLVVTANTVSGMPDALREVITVPVLDIVAPVFVQADNDGASRLGLLSTSATARSGIYQAAAADHGCAALLPPA